MVESAASTSSGRGRQRGWPRRLFRERCERNGRYVFAHQLSIPPPSRLPALGRGREPVSIIARAKIVWRVIRKWIRLQQRGRRGVATQQLLEERDEPFVLRLRGERLEPHQPVEPKMVGRDLRRPSCRITWLSPELVLPPRGAFAHRR